ncbi:MAG: carbohydrate ABC transporter permease, partial [Acetanaerobacterium sp.]
FFNSEAFTSALVSYIQWWMWFGYTTVIIMAGITAIDSSVYDAALVDGASKLKTYTYITIPLIRPTLIYITITSIIGGMQLFDVPATLTNGSGDPQKSVLTTSMYLYNQSFKNHNYGYASAVSVGLFIIIALLSIFAFRAMQIKGSAYDE